MGVEPKIGGKPPKMDGENNGQNPMKKLMIWGFSPYFWFNTHMDYFIAVTDPWDERYISLLIYHKDQLFM